MAAEDIPRLLSTGKARDRNAALQELSQILKHGNTRVKWNNLVLAYIRFFREDIEMNEEKIRDGSRAAISHFSTCFTILKDMMQVVGQEDPCCLDTKFLVFVQTILSTYKDMKSITSQFTKLLQQLVSIRTFRETLSPVQWEQLVSYCIDFFMEEQENTSQDRRGECVDLSMVFCQLVTCQWTESVMEHSERVLLFIAQYIQRYTFENHAFEIFLVTAIQVLIFLDVDQLDISFGFLKYILPRLIDLITSKTEALRQASINLFRMYIVIGSQREDDELFLRNASRMQAKIYEHFTKHSISPIPTTHFYQLLYNPEFEREFPNGASNSWPYLSLFSDLCWLEIHNLKTDIESQSHQSESTQVEEKTVKKMRTKNFKSFLDALLKDKSYCCFGLQVVMKMIYKRPSTIDYVIQELFPFILDLAINGDLHCVNDARLCCAIICEYRPAFSFDAHLLWEKTMVSISQTTVSYHGSFLLLARLIRDKRVTGNEISDTLDWLCTIKQDQISKYAGQLVQALFEYQHLWSHDQVCKFISFLFNLLKVGEKPLTPQVCGFFVQSVNVLFQVPIKMVEREKLIYHDRQPIIAEEGFIFDFYFLKFEERLDLVSGYNGAKLASLMWKTLEKAKSMVEIEFSNRLLEHIADECHQFCNWVVSYAESERTSVDSLVLLMLLCYFIQKGQPKNIQCVLRVPFLELLKQAKRVVFDSIAVFDLDSLLGKYFDFVSTDQENIFAPLSATASIELLEALADHCLKPPRQIVEKESKIAKYHILQTALLSEPIDFKKSIKVKAKMELIKRAVGSFSEQFDSSTLDAFSKSRNWIMNLLQTSDSTISHLVILGNNIGQLRNLLDVNMCLQLTKRFTKLLQNSRYSRNFTCWICCLRFLKALVIHSSFGITQNTELRLLLGELVKFFISTMETVPSIVMMEVVDLLKVVTEKRLPIETSKSIPEEIIKIFAQEDFVCKLYTSKYIVPFLSRKVNLSEQLDCLLIWESMSDVSAIGNSILLESFIRSNPECFDECFYYLAKLGSLHPSLDTVEAVILSMQQHFGQPNAKKLTKQALAYTLERWDRDVEEFPAFLFGYEDFREFVEAFCPELFSVSFRKRDFRWKTFAEKYISSSDLISSSLPAAYSEYLIRASEIPENKQADKLYFQSMFNITESDYQQLLKSHYKTIFVRLLTVMSGLNRFDSRLDDYLGTELAMYAVPHETPIKPKFMVVCKAIEMLHAGSFSAISKTLSAHRVLTLLQLLHEYMEEVGFENVIVRVLSNGYLVLLVLGKQHILHPLVFSTIFLNLAPFLKRERLTRYCIPILSHMISTLTPPYPESFSRQILKFILKLNEVYKWCKDKGYDYLPSICKLIQGLLEKLYEYDVKAFHVCSVILDQSVESHIPGFQVKQESIETLLTWPDHLDDDVFHSVDALTRIDQYLDDCTLPPIDLRRMVNRVEKEMFKFRGTDSKGWHLLMSRVYAKIKAIYPIQQGQITIENARDDDPSLLEIALMELSYFLFDPALKCQITSSEVLTNVGATAEGKIAFKCLTIDYKRILDILQQRPGAKLQRTPCEYEVSIWSSKCKSESEFLIQFALGLLNAFPFPDYILYLQPMLELSPQFSRKLIPYFASYVFREFKNEKQSKQWFLLSLGKTLDSYFDDNKIAISMAIDILKHFIEHRVEFDKTVIGFDRVSKLALCLQDYHSSYYFLELWYRQSNALSGSDWQVLMDCCNGLNDDDGFQGALNCLDTVEVDMMSLVKQNTERQRNWLSLWSIEDSRLQSSSLEESVTFVKALASSGHYHTLMKVLDTKQRDTEMYESLWRLGKWDIKSADILEPPNDFRKHIYHALHSFETSYSSKISLCVTQKLLPLAMIAPVRPAVIIPMMELEEFITNRTQLDKLLGKWKERDHRVEQNYSYTETETILSIKSRILRSELKRNDCTNQELMHYYVQGQFALLNLGLNNNDTVLSRRIIGDLKGIENQLGEEDKVNLEFLSIKAEWAGGQGIIPMRYLSALIDKTGQCELKNPKLFSDMLLTFAIWSMDKKANLAMEILEKYLKPSITALEQTENHGRGRHYFTFANYCDNILSEMQNDEGFKRSLKLLSTREASLKEAMSKGHSRKDHHIRRLEKQIDLDRASVKAAQDEMIVLALNSVENYMKVLIHSQYRIEHSLYRFFSLWFSFDAHSSVNEVVAKYLSKIETKLFLQLMYQISARLFSQDPDKGLFFRVLLSLVESVVADYPYHTLGFVLALRNVSKTTKAVSGVKTVSSDTINLFMAWIKKNKPIQLIAYHIDSLYNGYITTAYQPIPKTKDNSKPHSLESSCALFKIKPENLAPVITAEQPLGRPREYSDVIHVVSFEKTYTVPGGINAPKVIKCLGSDGIVYKQLVKGKDDLRQDAVLSSVFNTINTLLQKNRNTRTRNLHIRTYKIVPVAAQAGVVHWVNGTNPLGEILYEAHSKNTKDWTLHACRSKMKVEHERSGTTVESKLKVFRAIESHLQPVLGTVFFELYRSPIQWYHNRTNFTRSVATSSIAGYILGIGDRHSQNLLFDKTTGEVIHIDLGIAFDQGKLLSTPELVPFRLTRNIIDAMGMTQYHGVFKRGCEETLQVLRAEHEILFTLLDVFRYDPLHSWTVSPLKMVKLQRDEEKEEDELLFKTSQNSEDDEAGIALFGIKKKLSASISVEGQVQELINQAIDPRNLCRMFPGWQSWI